MRLLHPVVGLRDCVGKAICSVLASCQASPYCCVCQQLSALSRWVYHILGNTRTQTTATKASVINHVKSALRAEGGDPGLIDSDNAAPVVGAALQRVKDVQGEDAAKAAWGATGLQLSAFLFAVRVPDICPARTGTACAHPGRFPTCM